MVTAECWQSQWYFYLWIYDILGIVGHHFLRQSSLVYQKLDCNNLLTDAAVSDTSVTNTYTTVFFHSLLWCRHRPRRSVGLELSSPPRQRQPNLNHLIKTAIRKFWLSRQICRDSQFIYYSLMYFYSLLKWENTGLYCYNEYYNKY